MSITLERITFNTNTQAADARTLNLRRAGGLVTTPEWQRGVTVSPQQSVAAYAISQSQNPAQPITIQAEFSRSSFQDDNFLVRTRNFNASSTNAFGRVREGPVNFPIFTPNSGPQILELEQVSLGDLGVRAHTVTWRWQFCIPPDDTWTDFATTTHTIYAVLEPPKRPWRRLPFSATNFQLPWLEALDVACRWAAGARTPDDAAAIVTRQVYDLGPAFLQYDCPKGGPHFTDNSGFHCDLFLARLNNLEQVNSLTVPRVVNCNDCATITTTFANILGCDLSEAQMGGGDPFDVNPVLLIGSDAWSGPCGQTKFTFHEVAWEAGGTADDAVYDACLQVDGDTDVAPPHVPLLPSNLVFGRRGDGLYRDRLVMPDTPQSQQTCVPLLSPVRRQIHPPGTPVANFLDIPFLSALEIDFGVGDMLLGAGARVALRADSDDWLAANEPELKLFSSGFLLSESLFRGWRIARSAAARVDETVFAIKSLWTRKRGDGALLEVAVYECASRDEARKMLLRLTDTIQLPVVELRAAGDIGDVAFSLPGDVMILFARGNLAASVTTADGGAESVLDKAVRLDRYIARRPRGVHVGEDAPTIDSFEPETENFQPGMDIPLTVTATDPAGRHIWYRLFSRTGEVASVGGQLLYRPADSGEQRITAFALNSRQLLARERLRLSV
jgi:hypothetical protein